MAQREVIARNGSDSMVKVRWTGTGPDGLTDVEEAEELGAKWKGDELVVDDYLIDDD